MPEIENGGLARGKYPGLAQASSECLTTNTNDHTMPVLLDTWDDGMTCINGLVCQEWQPIGNS